MNLIILQMNIIITPFLYHMTILRMRSRLNFHGFRGLAILHEN